MVFGNTQSKYGNLFKSVDDLRNPLDPKDSNFSLFMEFIEYLDEYIPEIKDKSTGRSYAHKSNEANTIFGEENAQKMYKLLNKLVAYAESK